MDPWIRLLQLHYAACEQTAKLQVMKLIGSEIPFVTWNVLKPGIVCHLN